MKRLKHRVFVTLAMTICVGMVAFALVGVLPAGARSKGKAGSGSVTFAEIVGESPDYFFPMNTASHWTVGYEPWASYLMWSPLYIWGKDGKAEFNETRSVGETPVFSTNSAGDTVVTITLKKRYWSTGKPVTTRDVEFWMNLFYANKTTVAFYDPKAFPTNVKKINYLSSTKFQIVFDKKYSTLWLEGDVLTDITPIPQQAWDKTSTSSPVGTDDTTTSGAKAVYKYLQKEASSASTLGTNPLWKVVDGPFQISSYDVTNGNMSLVLNPKYTGPKSSKEISKLTEIAYTSNTAELDALVSGTLDVGYVPLTELKSIPKLESSGYKTATWRLDGWGDLGLQYNKDLSSTPIFEQQYVREALVHLLTMTAIVKKIYHGHGYYASSPVPNPSGHTSDVTPTGAKDPYPYSISKAKKLLTDHGWHVIPDGVTTCVKPGTASDECGKGISKGAKMSFKVLGTETTTPQYDALEYIISQFSLIGVNLKAKLASISGLATLSGTCVGTATCSFNMRLDVDEWPYGWPTSYPSGVVDFSCGSSGNYWNICNAENDTLISDAETSSTPVAGLEKWENYMAKEQYVIFFPDDSYRGVVVYKKNIHGVVPLTPFLYIQPTSWSVTK